MSNSQGIMKYRYWQVLIHDTLSITHCSLHSIANRLWKEMVF